LFKFDYEILKKILFLFNPEKAHNIAEYTLKTIGACNILKSYLEKKNYINDEKLHQEIFGLKFENPVGLAAGFDKNATMIRSMKSLGFGFSEIGTITPMPQDGNTKPRIFRYPKQKSIQNAMGFNNLGSHAILKNLQKAHPFFIPIGINIGKNKTTPEEFALSDYKSLIKKFEKFSDYLVINISSPNTPKLRDLQNENFIAELFTTAKTLTQKPVLLKIAPDISVSKALKICKTAISNKADGIIATNTTTDYSLLPNCKDFGGLSGECLSEKSSKLFQEIAKKLYGKTILISVGGISNAKEAYKRIKDGASLVQVYSGLIFQGPLMARKINEEILELLKEDGFSSIKEAVGANLR